VKGTAVADSLFTLPLASLPDGADPATFYGTFAGKLTAAADGDAVSVWVADEGNLATIYTPVKAAMRFAPSGTTVGNSTVNIDTLVLNTWPLTYTDLQKALESSVPAQIMIGNVDRTGIRDAVRDLYIAIGKPEASADSFMTGNGLLLVSVGTPVGKAAPGTAPPHPTMSNNVEITAVDVLGESVNVTQFFASGAALAGIDTTMQPLLIALPLEGWIDIVVLDQAGNPLTTEAYDLYLSDGTTRSGTTDAHGRIAEAGMPPGEWALDLPGQPSFAFLESGA
jgi:hypothetical protein